MRMDRPVGGPRRIHPFPDELAWSEPSASITQTLATIVGSSASRSTTDRVKAIRRPSGDHAGSSVVDRLRSMSCECS